MIKTVSCFCLYGKNTLLSYIFITLIGSKNKLNKSNRNYDESL